MAEETTGATVAPVAQEAGSGVEEGNITFDQMAGMLVRPEEAGESADVSEEGDGEATEQVTDAEPETEPDSDTGDASEEEDGEDEVPPEQTEDDDVLSKLSPKAAEKARKRIDKLTARAKSAEEALQAKEAELEQLNSRLSKLEQAASEPKQDAKELSFADRVDRADTAQDLDKLRDIAKKTKAWCRENWDEHEVELGEQTISHKELARMLNEAEHVLEEVIPKRQQYLKTRQVAAQNALNDFPAWKDKESPDHKRLMALWNDPAAKETFHKLPNGAYLVGVLLEGMKVLEAKKAKPKEEEKQEAEKPVAKKEQKIAPKVPGSEASAAPTADSTDFEKRFSSKDTLSQDDLVAYFASRERGKTNRKG